MQATNYPCASGGHYPYMNIEIVAVQLVGTYACGSKAKPDFNVLRSGAASHLHSYYLLNTFLLLTTHTTYYSLLATYNCLMQCESARTHTHALHGPMAHLCVRSSALCRTIAVACAVLGRARASLNGAWIACLPWR